MGNPYFQTKHKHVQGGPTEIYTVDSVDIAWEMEQWAALARAARSARFFPFPVRQPPYPHCTTEIEV